MHLVRLPCAVLAGGCFLAVLSCAKASSTNGAGGPEEVVTVYKAPAGRFDRKVREVVKDAARWHNVWDSVTGTAGLHQSRLA